jgi:hypothetical protein
MWRARGRKTFLPAGFQEIIYPQDVSCVVNDNFGHLGNLIISLRTKVYNQVQFCLIKLHRVWFLRSVSIFLVQDTYLLYRTISGSQIWSLGILIVPASQKTLTTQTGHCGIASKEPIETLQRAAGAFRGDLAPSKGTWRLQRGPGAFKGDLTPSKGSWHLQRRPFWAHCDRSGVFLVDWFIDLT